MMKPSKILIALVCLSSSICFSQTAAPTQKPSFQSIDKNGDGKITAAEAKAAGITDADFKKADKNGDGSLTVDEYLNVR